MTEAIVTRQEAQAALLSNEKDSSVGTWIPS